MIKALFLEDSYLKKCDATVVAVSDGKYIVLDQTVFYPKGGGQPHDTGKIIHENNVFNTIYVGKFKGSISHEVDKVGLNNGDKVHCILDWKRRYKLMRNHTAAHTLAAILEKETGALITGNQLEEDKVRFDFNLDLFLININTVFILGIITLVVGILIIVIAVKVSKEREKIVFSYILYVIAYWFLFSFWWLVAIYYKLTGKKLRWDTKKSVPKKPLSA